MSWFFMLLQAFIHICLFQIYEALVEEKCKTCIFLRVSKRTVDELGLKSDSDFKAQVSRIGFAECMDKGNFFNQSLGCLVISFWCCLSVYSYK